MHYRPHFVIFVNMDIKQKFGQRIKELRKAKGLSQEKLANLAEIDRTYLPTIEKGERNVSIEVVEKLRSENNLVKIVMLSMHESEEYVLKSIKAGADGYLLKGSSKEEFLKAVHTIANGGKYFSGDISSILIGQLSNPTTAMETKQSLDEELMITKREKEILKLLLSGKGNKEIAEALEISKRTAEVHRFNLMKKLKVKNLMELSNKATEYSLL